ncbi:MAG TPA: DUF4364 family protein [Lachnospiraceae bacterium]|nr:DUF4364 family protein [Lachnospiraceae bacterium]
MSDALTLYKLIILYMLRKVTFPLTNAQITEFIVGKDYTDYFHVQEAVNDLLEANLITSERIRNTSQYQATLDGERTLEYFGNSISDAIKADIDEYMKANAFEMRNESCTRADYDRTESKEYAVHCRVQEGSETVIDLTINVPTEEEAEKVCSHWPEKSQEIYMDIMNKLL